MMNRPPDALVLSTYDEYQYEIDSWAAECCEGTADPLLIALGPPGIGKTEIICRALQQRGFDENQVDGYGFRSGVMRGLNLYHALYAYRHNPFVVDDISALLDDPRARDVLLPATDTRRTRLVCWETTHRSIGEGLGQAPSKFEYNGHLAINANGWTRKHDAVMQAILSRGTCFVFEPSVEEVFAYAGGWYPTLSVMYQEVYDYIGGIISELPRLDLRVLVRHAPRLVRRYPHEWRDRLKKQLVPSEAYPSSIVKQLVGDPSFDSEDVRREEFIRLTGMSERSYWRYKKELHLSDPRRPRVPPEQDHRRRESRVRIGGDTNVPADTSDTV